MFIWLFYVIWPSPVIGCNGYNAMLSLITLTSSSGVSFDWVGKMVRWLGALNKLPWLLLLLANGSVPVVTGLEMVVLSRWLQISFIGELSSAVLLAVHHSSIVSWVVIFSAAAALSLCFCTPWLMYPISTAFMAFANNVQLAWSSGTFSLRTSGKLSHSVNNPKLIVVSIFACLARSRIFSANTTWV